MEILQGSGMKSMCVLCGGTGKWEATKKCLACKNGWVDTIKQDTAIDRLLSDVEKGLSYVH